MGEIVQLYTLRTPEDSAPQVFQYYIDQTGADVVNYVLYYFQMENTSTYNVFYRSPDGSITDWIGPTETLRSKNITNGYFIGIVPAAQQPEYQQPEPDQNTSEFSSNTFTQSNFNQPSTYDQGFNQHQGFDQAQGFGMSTDFGVMGQGFDTGTGGFGFGTNFGLDSGFSGPVSTFGDMGSALPDPNALGFQSSMFSGFPSTSIQDNSSFDVMSNYQSGIIQNTSSFDSYSSGLGESFDFSIDSSISEFNSNLGFGGLQAEVKKSDEKSSVQIQTCFEFTDKFNPVKYLPNMSFDDALQAALTSCGKYLDGRYALLIENDDLVWFNDPNKYLEDFQIDKNTKIRLFKQDKSIKIKSKWFDDKTLTLDICAPIKENIKIIGKKLDLDAYHCYTLYSMENSDRMLPMSVDLSIPQQTKQLKRVFFARRYFIFSLEDLSTMKSAVAAFNDAVEKADTQEMSMDINRETRLIATRIAGSSNGNVHDYDVPDDIIPLLPKNYYKRTKKLQHTDRDRVVKYINENPMNQFTGIRDYLKFIRRTFGFAEHMYDLEVTTDQRGNNVMDAIVSISPYRILISDPDNNEPLECVSYSEIIDLKTFGRNLEISFQPRRNRIAKYNFRGKGTDKMKQYIERCIQITHDITADRARKFAQAGDISKIISDKYRISLATTSDLHYANSEEYDRLFDYDRKFTGSIMRTAALRYLNIKPKNGEEYVILIRKMKGNYQWVPEDSIIINMQLQDGMCVIVLKKIQVIKFSGSGWTKTLQVDITKTIDDIIKDVFAARRQPHILGYTLWDLTNKDNPYPLDSSSTIPEQIEQFHELGFARRFFVLSKEVLQDKETAKSALHDSFNYVIKENFKFDEETAAKLTMYYLYGDERQEIRKTRWDLKQFLPRSVVITKSLQDLFNTYIQRQKDMTCITAIKHYINIVRQLDGFGSETFELKKLKDTSDVNNVLTYKPAYMLVGPLSITFLDANRKTIYDKLHYRYKKHQEYRGNKMSVTYAIRRKDGEGIRIINLEFVLKDSVTANMVINYNQVITRRLQILNQERQRALEEEIMKKMKGGWKDEEGKVHGPMLDFRVGRWGSNILTSVWLDLDLTYEQVIDAVFKVIPKTGLDKTEDIAVMVQIIKGNNRWLKPNMLLGDVHPYRDSIIYIHQATITCQFFAGQNSKKLTIDVRMPVSDVIILVGKKLKIKHAIGYALFVPKHDNTPEQLLDTELSIPEQTDNYEKLLFRRHFFILGKNDMDDPVSLNITYEDVKALILSGSVQMKANNAELLAYLQLWGDNDTAVTENMIPRDLSQIFPVGFDISPKARHHIKRHITNTPVIDRRDGQIKYINHARFLPMFGATSYKIILVTYKNGIAGRTPGIVFIGPNQIFVVDRAASNKLASVEYKHYIRCENTDTEVSVKFSKEGTNLSDYILFESDRATQIASVIRRHVEIITQLLLIRLEDYDPTEDPNQSSERVTLNVVNGWKKEADDNNSLRIAFDMRMSGEQVLQRSIQALKLDTSGDYTPLLRLANDEYRWIKPKDILGKFFPCDGMRLQLFQTNTLINAHLSNGEKAPVLVDITRPLHELIPIICDKLFIDYYIGYTLYIERPPKKPIPLDLFFSIPEQTGENVDFLLKRRFFSMTFRDRFDQTICEAVYPDTRHNVLSGKVSIEGAKANELAVYQIYASNQEEDPRNIELPDDVQALFPRNYKEKIDPNGLITKIHESELILPRTAMQKFIDISRKLPHFGSKQFNVIMYEENRIDEPQEISISIGPLGILLQGNIKLSSGDYYQFNDGIDYDHLCDYTLMVDHIILRLYQTNSRIRTFVFSDHIQAPEMFKLIRQYKAILNEIINKRSKIQDIDEDDPLFKIIQNVPSPVDVGLTRRLDNPHPPLFTFGQNMVRDEIIDLACYYLIIPRTISEYAVMHKDADGNFKWIQATQSLFQAQATNKSVLYLIKSSPILQIYTQHGITRSIQIDVTQSVKATIGEIGHNFQIGYPIGFTFYDKRKDGTLRPLDNAISPAFQSHENAEFLLMRRFFLYGKQMLSDPVTLFSFYRDCRYLVLQGTTNISEEKATELAVVSLYAQSSDMNSVLGIASELQTFEIQALYPKNFQFNKAMERRFKNAITTMSPMQQLDAQMYYITSSSALEGFGTEQYPCTAIDSAEMMSQSVMAQILLSPYFVRVYNELDIIAEVGYNNIISFSMEMNNDTGNPMVLLKFQDINGVFHSLEIQSEMFIREIDSFIRGIIELYQLDDIYNANEMFTQNQVQGNLDQFQDNSIMINAFMQDFDDIGAINFDDTIGYSSDIGNVGMFNFDQESTISDYYNDTNRHSLEESEDLGNIDLSWRTTGDALNLVRNQRTLDLIEDELGTMNDEIGSIDPTEFFKQLTVLNDQVDLACHDVSDDELKGLFLNLRDNFDAIIDTAQQIVKSDQEIAPYVETINVQIANILSAIKPTKQQSTAALETFKHNYNEERSSYGMIIQREVPKLSLSLIMLSDTEETIASEILKRAGELGKLGYATNQLVDSIHAISTTFTAISGTINDNPSDQAVLVHLIPQLIKCKKQLKDISELIKFAQENNINVYEITAARKKLKDIIALAYSQVKEMTDNNINAKPKRFQIVYGINNFDSAVTTIEELNTINVSNSKAKEIIARTNNKVKHATDKLRDANKIIQLDPTNINARYDVIYALQAIRDNLMDTVDYLTEIGDPSSQKAIEQYRNALRNINISLHQASTRNITPRNVARVNDDLNFIVNRESQLTGANIDPVLSGQVTDVIHMLKDANFALQQHQFSLQVNPANGEALDESQKVLIELDTNMPNIQATLENVSGVVGDNSIPIVAERLSANVSAALQDKVAAGEDITKIDYAVRVGNIQNAISIYLNDVAETAETPRIINDDEMKNRCDVILESAQRLYVDTNEIRAAIFEAPFDLSTINQTLEYVDRASEQAQELQNLNKRVADASMNMKLEQEVTDITNAITQLKPATEKHQASLGLKKSVEIAKVEKPKKPKKPEWTPPPPPSIEEVNAIFATIQRLATLSSQLAAIPVVSSDPQLYQAVAALYGVFAQKYQEIQSELASPTMNSYEIARIVMENAEELHKLMEGIPTIATQEAYMAQVPYIRTQIQPIIARNVKPSDEDDIIEEEIFAPEIQQVEGASTLPACQKSLTAITPCFKSLKSTLEKLISSEQAKNNPAVNQVIIDWMSALDGTIADVNPHITMPNYSAKQAAEDKMSLTALTGTLSKIPPSFRRTFTPEQMEDLAKGISEIIDTSKNSIVTIRMLPVAQKRIVIDISNFPHGDPEMEIDEMAPIVERQASMTLDILNKIVMTERIANSPHTLKFVKQMISQLQQSGLSALTRSGSEEKMIEILNNARTIMPSLITQGEIITPVIEDKGMIKAIKIFNESANSLQKLLIAPHMNRAKLTEFTSTVSQTVQGLIQSIQQVIATVPETPRTKFALGYLSRILNIVTSNLSLLTSMKPRQAQTFCDDVYSAICAVLPSIYECPEFEAIENVLIQIAKVSERFTSLPAQCRLKTESLLVKRAPVAEESINALIDLTGTYMRSGGIQLSQELLEAITDDLDLIRDHQDIIPEHIAYAANMFSPLIRIGDTSVFPDAARIVVSTNPEFAERDQSFMTLLLHFISYSAICLCSLADSLQYLQSQISPGQFSPETLYYSDMTKRAIKNIDVKILADSPSIPVAVMNYNAMHRVIPAVGPLISSVKDNISVRQIVQPISVSLCSYVNAINKLDTLLASILAFQLDIIANELLNEQVNNSQQCPVEAAQFTHGVYPLLKAKDRSVSLTMSDITKLAQMYNFFTSSVMPKLNLQTPIVSNAVNTLSPINIIIQSWANPEEATTSPADARDAITGTIYSIMADLERIQSLAESNPSQAQYYLANTVNLSSTLNNIIERAKELGVSSSDLEQRTKSLITLLEQLRAASQQASINEINQNIVSLRDILTSLNDVTKRSIEINFDSATAAATFKPINVDLYIPHIEDNTLKQIAVSASTLLNDARKRYDALAVNAEKAKKVDTKEIELIDRLNAFGGSIVSVMLNPIILSTSSDLSSIAANTSKTISAQGAGVRSASIPLIQQEKLAEMTPTMLLTQRIQAIQQKQLAEFPDVIRRLQKEHDVKLTSDMVTDALMSIQNQYNLMEDAAKLHELHHRLTPDEVVAQQLVLAEILKKLDESPEKLQIIQSVAAFSALKKNMIDYAITEQSQKPLIVKVTTPTEVNRAVTRLNNLTALMQSLERLSQFEIQTVPEILKFSQSPEGQAIIKQTLSPAQVLGVQQEIIKLVSLLNDPEQLRAYINTITPESLINQQKVIKATLDMLSSDKAFDIVSDNTADASLEGVMKATNNTIQELAKVDPTIFDVNSLIDTETIRKSQEACQRLLVRQNLANSLVSLQSATASVSPDALNAMNATNIQDGVSPEIMKALGKFVYDQSELLKTPDAFIQYASQLAPQHFQQMQPCITQLASSIATCPDALIPIESSALEAQITPIFEAVQDLISDAALDNLELAQIAAIKPLETEDLTSVCSVQGSIVKANNDTFDISQLISKVRTLQPQIDQYALSGQAAALLQQQMSESTMDRARANMLRLQELQKTSPSAAAEFLRTLPSEQTVIIYSLMNESISQMADINKLVDKINEKSRETRLFDRAMLIQREPKKGLSSATTSTALPDSASISGNIVSSYQTVALSTLASMISRLMAARAQCAPIITQVNPASLMEISTKVTPERVVQLQQALLQQLAALGQPQLLQDLISQQSSDDLILQQAMLQHLNYMGSTPQVIDAVLQTVQCNPQNPLDEANVVATANDAASKILGVLNQYQQQYLNQQPTQLGQMPITSLSDLITISNASLENLDRSLIKSRSSLIAATALSDQNIAQIVTAKRGDGNIKLNMTPDEVAEAQASVKSLLALPLTPERISRAFVGRSENDVLGQLAVLNNLSQISKPTSTLVSVFTPKENLVSLFNTDISYTPISASSLNISRPKTELSAVTTAAQTANDIIPVLATFSKLPISECKSIMQSVNADAIQAVEQLMTSSNQATLDEAIQKLNDCTPQLIASTSRILDVIPDQKLRGMLIQDPTSLLSDIMDITMTSSAERTPEMAQKYRQLCSKLYDELKTINAGVSTETSDKLVNVLTSLVKALRTNDAEKIQHEIADYNAFKVSCIREGIPIDQLSPISTAIDQVVPHIQNIYVHGAAPDAAVTNYLQHMQAPIIQLINANTANPFESLGEIKSAEQIDALLEESRAQLSVSTDRLINSISARNHKASRDAISDIIKSVADSQAAMFRGFDIQQVDSSPVYRDYITMIGNSMSAINNILDIQKNKTASNTAIRRSTRSFNRMIYSMTDMLEERERSGKPLTELEKARTDFARGAASALQMIIQTVSARAGSTLPEAFQSIIQKELPRMDKVISDMKEKSAKLQSINTDKTAAVDFENELNALIGTFDEFKKTAANAQTNTLEDVTGCLNGIADNMQATLMNAERLTDEVIKMPDMEAAEMLPRTFQIPTVPADKMGKKIQDVASTIGGQLDDAIKKKEALFKTINKPGTTNKQIVQAMLPLYDAMTAAVVQILLISTLTMNLDFQNKFSTAAADVVTHFDSILRALRDRFLLRGDWDGISASSSAEIAAAFDLTKRTAIIAAESAERDEKEHAAVFAKFMKAVQPLSEHIGKFEEDSKKLDATTPSLSTEFALSILKPALGIGQAIKSILLYSKDHPDCLEKIDAALEAAVPVISTLAQAGDSISKVSGGASEPESLLSTALNACADSAEAFIKACGTKHGEVKKLAAALNSLIQSSRGTARSAMAALEVKRAQEKRRKEGASATKGSSAINIPTAPKTNLMKRLELESRVIRARTILERSEKQLSKLQ